MKTMKNRAFAYLLIAFLLFLLPLVFACCETADGTESAHSAQSDAPQTSIGTGNVELTNEKVVYEYAPA